MRVLVLASYAESLINFRGPLLNAFLASGAEVHVGAPFDERGNRAKDALEEMGVIVHSVEMERTGTNPLADLLTLARFIFLMARIRPGYVLAYTIKPVVYGLIAARFTRVPYRFALITGLGYAFQGGVNDRSLLRRLVGYLYRAAIRKADKVFFQNPDDEALFYKLGILQRSVSKSVVVNGSGIDVSAFKFSEPSTELKFLLIARLLGDKGVREYVEAASVVKRLYPSVTFELVGWIDENPDSVKERELQQWIESGTVQFVGRLDDVRAALSNCSVYVLPSYREGTPRTVLEAMASGRPVITTDAPGCRETVIDGYNGFLVPIKSVGKLADAMIKFVEQPELIALMGRRSRLIAEKKYDVNKVNAQMLDGMGLK